MGLWSIVKSSPTQVLTNWVSNPSAETDMNGWSASGGATLTHDVTYARFGAYSVGISLPLVGATGNYVESPFRGGSGQYYVSLYLLSSVGGNVTLEIYDGLTLRYSTTATLTAFQWQRVVTPSPITLTFGAAVNIALKRPTAGGASLVNVDGLMICAVNGPYFDGDSEGCWWLGRVHRSPSRADGYADTLGETIDLGNVSATVVGWTGAGMPPAQVLETALPPGEIGSAYAGTKVGSRTLQLLLRISGNSLAGLHALRRILVDALRPGARVVVQYAGASKPQTLVAHYAGGLEGQRAPGSGFAEEIALRLVATDPLWREDAQVVAFLPSNSSINFAFALGRINGAWTALGSPAGTNGSVFVIKVTPQGEIYFGGAFTTAGGVTVNGIARYDPVTNTWSALGSGVSGGYVYAIEADTQGNLYVGGTFTSAGGVANTDGIAKYDPATNTWSALGTGRTTSGGVYALAYSPEGYLYAGGDFDGMSGVANTARLAVYNFALSAWESITPAGVPDNTVRTIVTIPTKGVYVGGDFTTINGITAKNVAFRSASGTWSPVGDGFNNTVSHLLWDARGGTLYATGTFTQSGVDTCRALARWNGAWWEEVGDGLTGGAGNQMALTPDGRIIVCGYFTSFGGNAGPIKGLAVWNNPGWSYLDLASTTWDNFICVATLGDDIYLGSDLSQTVNTSSRVTVKNPGSAPVKPAFFVRGDSRVWMVVNHTLRQQIYLNGLRLGVREETWLDLESQKMTSRWRPGVNLLNQALPVSDLADFELAPGDNVVGLLCTNVGAGATQSIAVVPRNWSVDVLASSGGA